MIDKMTIISFITQPRKILKQKHKNNNSSNSNNNSNNK